MGYFMGGWDITARVFELLKVLVHIAEFADACHILGVMEVW